MGLQKPLEIKIDFDKIVDDFISKSGTGSKYWDSKYGIRVVNRAVIKGLHDGKIYLYSRGNPMILTTDDYGLKSALRHRDLSIYKRK